MSTGGDTGGGITRGEYRRRFRSRHASRDDPWWRYNRSVRFYGVVGLGATKLADVVTTAVGVRHVPGQQRVPLRPGGPRRRGTPPRAPGTSERRNHRRAVARTGRGAVRRAGARDGTDRAGVRLGAFRRLCRRTVRARSPSTVRPAADGAFRAGVDLSDAFGPFRPRRRPQRIAHRRSGDRTARRDLRAAARPLNVDE